MGRKSKLFSVRAYCTDCGRLLMESERFCKKDLIARWDSAVIGATCIACNDCGHRPPNFNINLKIYQHALKKEFDVDAYIPKPKSPVMSPDDLFK